MNFGPHTRGGFLLHIAVIAAFIVVAADSFFIPPESSRITLVAQATTPTDISEVDTQCPTGAQYDYSCSVGQISATPGKVCQRGKQVSDKNIRAHCVGEGSARCDERLEGEKWVPCASSPPPQGAGEQPLPSISDSEAASATTGNAPLPPSGQGEQINNVFSELQPDVARAVPTSVERPPVVNFASLDLDATYRNPNTFGAPDSGNVGTPLNALSPEVTAPRSFVQAEFYDVTSGIETGHGVFSPGQTDTAGTLYREGAFTGPGLEQRLEMDGVPLSENVEDRRGETYSPPSFWERAWDRVSSIFSGNSAADQPVYLGELGSPDDQLSTDKIAELARRGDFSVSGFPDPEQRAFHMYDGQTGELTPYGIAVRTSEQENIPRSFFEDSYWQSGPAFNAYDGQTGELTPFGQALERWSREYPSRFEVTPPSTNIEDRRNDPPMSSVELQARLRWDQDFPGEAYAPETRTFGGIMAQASRETWRSLSELVLGTATLFQDLFQ